MATLMETADLEGLRDFLAARQDELPTEWRAKSVDWLTHQLEVREAQRTRNRTPFHRDQMAAYDAAVAEWEAYREAYGNGYATETADYERVHPRPLLKDFMSGYRPTNQVTCPACGITFNPEEK